MELCLGYLPQIHSKLLSPNRVFPEKISSISLKKLDLAPFHRLLVDSLYQSARITDARQNMEGGPK